MTPREIYLSVVHDLGEHDLDTAVDVVGDMMFDLYGRDDNRNSVIREALRDYFTGDEQ